MGFSMNSTSRSVSKRKYTDVFNVFCFGKTSNVSGGFHLTLLTVLSPSIKGNKNINSLTIKGLLYIDIEKFEAIPKFANSIA